MLPVLASITIGCSDRAGSIAASAFGGKPPSTSTTIVGTDSRRTAGVKELSPALREDLEIIARHGGITIEQAAKMHAVQEIFGALQARISTRRPNQFAGARLGARPNELPTIYLKGPPDEFILEAIGSPGIRVAVVSGLRYSRIEMETRQGRVARAIREIGYTAFSVSENTRPGRIDVFVAFHLGLPTASTYVRQRLPKDIRDDVRITMEEDYLSPEIREAIEADEPGVHPFGPLAIEERPTAASAGVRGPSGTVEIDDKCVHIKSSGPLGTRRTLLSFRARDVQWDGTRKEIVFTKRRGAGEAGVIRVKNGDEVTTGGNDAKRNSDAWLVPPDPSCKGPIFIAEEAVSGRDQED